jgi:hypothetical protein
MLPGELAVAPVHPLSGERTTQFRYTKEGSAVRIKSDVHAPAGLPGQPWPGPDKPPSPDGGPQSGGRPRTGLGMTGVVS